jgi:hypothetical protein
MDFFRATEQMTAYKHADHEDTTNVAPCAVLRIGPYRRYDPEHGPSLFRRVTGEHYLRDVCFLRNRRIIRSQCEE